MRLEGWESRLDAVIEDARHRAYALGEHDCFRLACRVIEALTGVDRWPECRGYRSQREALAVIARFGANSAQAGDTFFGGERLKPALARRGDICLYGDERGEHHLGICLGRDMALLGEPGLQFRPVALATCAWAID